MDDTLEAISQQMIERYSARYHALGYDVRTLGWGTVEQQEYRLLQTLCCDVDFKGRTVVDIGCGFGDYYKMLKALQVPIAGYRGYDLNPDLVAAARERWKSESNVSFEVKNIVGAAENTMPVADIGLMIGVLNLHLKETFDNYRYSELAIRNAYALVREVLIVDFLSTHRTPEYPAEDFVFYHDPSVMLAVALTLSSRVVLKHDYRPIPQKEFMLFIYK